MGRDFVKTFTCADRPRHGRRWGTKVKQEEAERRPQTSQDEGCGRRIAGKSSPSGRTTRRRAAGLLLGRPLHGHVATVRRAAVRTATGGLRVRTGLSRGERTAHDHRHAGNQSPNHISAIHCPSSTVIARPAAKCSRDERAMCQLRFAAFDSSIRQRPRSSTAAMQESTMR